MYYTKQKVNWLPYTRHAELWSVSLPILMYYIERGAQPEAFANIGDGLWWSIVAFTTVSYGDIYPVTPLEKILSSIISLIRIANSIPYRYHQFYIHEYYAEPTARKRTR